MLVITTELGATTANENIIEATKTLANSGDLYKSVIFHTFTQFLSLKYEEMKAKGPLRW